MAKCDYCGKEINHVGTLTISELVDKANTSEVMSIRFGDRELHLECWVRKKWLERGWVEEFDDRVCVFE